MAYALSLKEVGPCQKVAKFPKRNFTEAFQNKPAASNQLIEIDLLTSALRDLYSAHSGVITGQILRGFLVVPR